MIDRFLYYIVERESIRLKKEAGKPRPWTDDDILNTYKFTNVQRINDYTTKRFAKTYKFMAGRPILFNREVALFHCALYRYFGTETWANYIGTMETPSKDRTQKVALQAIEDCKSIFTGAYVITNGGDSRPKHEVVVDYLFNFWPYAGTVTDVIDKTGRWQEGYKKLSMHQGFGGTGFMAKEVLQDYLIYLSYFYAPEHISSQIHDYYSFTPVGPGARRGLNRFHRRTLMFRQREAQWSLECSELLDKVQPVWNEVFPNAPYLTAHDIQFCLCEFDKYQRTLLGEGRPRSTYIPRASNSKVE